MHGHVVRRPHPTDRRAVTVEITPETHREVRRTMGQQHARRFEELARDRPWLDHSFGTGVPFLVASVWDPAGRRYEP